MDIHRDCILAGTAVLRSDSCPSGVFTKNMGSSSRGTRWLLGQEQSWRSSDEAMD